MPPSAKAKAKPKPKAKTSLKQVTIQEPPTKKPRSHHRYLLPWDPQEIQAFVGALNISPEGTFERFCRQQLRELPGVQLDDCKAHWLVLPPEDQAALMTDQERFLMRAMRIFERRMHAIGLRDPVLLNQRWRTLSWREKQDYLEDAEEQLEFEEPDVS
eukprot:GGOE01055337.1.p2 GENE.GGOE01055337.1~~GGOE01055337.1.p2  ORF type:complete len:158 (+),score=15.65 GGOE01055337.1:643-1116(+)